METSLSFTNFHGIDCQVVVDATDTSCHITFPKNEEGVFIARISDLASNELWHSSKYIWFDATNEGPHSMALTLSFWDADNSLETPNLVSTIGLLPGLKTRVSFPLEAIDSQRMFLPRTPGKLKTVIHGNKVRNLSRFAVGKKKCSDKQTLTVEQLHLSIDEPEYPIYNTELVDELGQWKGNDWPGKTIDENDLIEKTKKLFTQSKEALFFSDWTELGSWKNKKFESTGFFRTHYDGSRWWLADPEGYAFYSNGVDCVGYGEGFNTNGILGLCSSLPDKTGPYAEAWKHSDYHLSNNVDLFDFTQYNLMRVFGSDWFDAWCKLTRANMVNNGFNTIGNWSNQEFCHDANLPYVFPMNHFPSTNQKIFRDFPDVFSSEYFQNATLFAAQMESLKEDRNLIGYFLRNEPEWAFIKELNIAEELLETNFETDSKNALIHYLTVLYENDILQLNNSWESQFPSFDSLRKPIYKASKLSSIAEHDLRAFSRSMVDKYVRIPSEAVRKVDSNHLNLGMRYGFISSDDLLAGSDCFDVFSINCYDIDPSEAINKAGQMTKLPIMIGEFHFGALDRGLSATGIRGAANQTERGLAYRYYAEKAASSPFCVGIHYFQYNDQPTLGRFDGENYNIGLIDQCQTPHTEFLKEVVTAHKNSYRVAAGLQAPTEESGELVHPIFF